MLKENRFDIEESETRTIKLLKSHSYRLQRDSILRTRYLGLLKEDGSIEIEYSSHPSTLFEQLEFRNFLEEQNINYQEEGLSKVKKNLTKRYTRLTDLLNRVNNIS